MTTLSQEHLATTEEYQLKVVSSDWEEYIYYATITDDHSIEQSYINVETKEEEPEDHEEIVNKIEQSLSTMY